MGLKTNGTFLGLTGTYQMGGGRFVDLKSEQKGSSDYARRSFTGFAGLDSIPNSYAYRWLFPALKAGSISTRVAASASIIAGMGATANLSAPVNGTATLTPNMFGGYGMGSTISGTGTLTTTATAIAGLAAIIQIGSTPSAIDIRDEIMNSVLENGQTVSEALNQIQDIKNTTSAVLGLSV